MTITFTVELGTKTLTVLRKLLEDQMSKLSDAIGAATTSVDAAIARVTADVDSLHAKIDALQATVDSGGATDADMQALADLKAKVDGLDPTSPVTVPA